MSASRDHTPGRMVKIVVTGPFAAGKTTFVRTISDVTVLSTERTVTEGPASLKGQTTVAMDYGRISVPPDLGISLFGTPGQERFDFMWDVLSEGMLGYVLVVDASRPASYGEAVAIRGVFADLADVASVVAVNKLAVGDDPQAAIARVRAVLGVGEDVPVVACDARDRTEVEDALVALLLAVLDRVAPPSLVGETHR